LRKALLPGPLSIIHTFLLRKAYSRDDHAF